MTEQNFDLKIIRVALERAAFADYRFRDGINDMLKSMQLDLDEIGFEPSENTKEVVEALETLISEFETPFNEEVIHILKDDEDVINNTREIESDDDNDDDELYKDLNSLITNVDADVDEFESPT